MSRLRICIRLRTSGRAQLGNLSNSADTPRTLVKKKKYLCEAHPNHRTFAYYLTNSNQWVPVDLQRAQSALITLSSVCGIFPGSRRMAPN
jgi:hypothetical protein